VGLDVDSEALTRAEKALRDSPARVHLRRANFAALEDELDALGLGEVDMVLFDLGMSSLQVETPERGFSFRARGPLDMRMDDRAAVTAASVVNRSSERELAEIFLNFGQEREARRIARAIVRERTKRLIATTVELASLVERAKRNRRGRIHPATRVFQALRIAVNREIEALEKGLAAAWRRLAPLGRMAVISFHSLEDARVKRFFRERAREGTAELLTRRPVRPSAAEVAVNPRARSARLRVLRKTGDAPCASPEGAA